MRPLCLASFLLASLACGGSSPTPAPEAKADAPKPKPPDESRRFPKENRVSMELIDDNLLGKDYLPGGNLAAYQSDGKTYQLFLLALQDPDSAALLAFDVKGKLTGAKLVPSFGGYYGLDGDTPWFLFAKNQYLAGVVGLPQDEADLVARDFAARIP